MKTSTLLFHLPLAVLLLIASIPVLAQSEFQLLVDLPATEDYNDLVSQNDSTGLVIASSTTSVGAGDKDICVYAVDNAGNLEWGFTYGGPAEEFSSSITNCSGGGYLVSARSASVGSGGSSIVLIKMDDSGVMQWTKYISGDGNEYGRYISEMANGDFLISCYTTGWTANTTDMFVLRIDDIGEVIWARVIGIDHADFGYKHSEMPNGDIVVSGYRRGWNSGNWNSTITRLDATGNTIWTREYDNQTGHEHYLDVIPMPGNGFMVCGYSDLGSSESNIILQRMNGAGDIVWSRSYGSSGDDAAYDLQQVSSNEFLLAGTVESMGSGGSDAFMMSVDSNGIANWLRTYGGTNDESYWPYSSMTLTNGQMVNFAAYTASFDAQITGDYILRQMLNPVRLQCGVQEFTLSPDTFSTANVPLTFNNVSVPAVADTLELTSLAYNPVTAIVCGEGVGIDETDGTCNTNVPTVLAKGNALEFDLLHSSDFKSLSIYNVQGECVHRSKYAGSSWRGEGEGTGIYIYQLEHSCMGEDHISIGKVVLVD